MAGELTDRQAYLALNSLTGVGPIGINRLLEAFKGDPRAILGAGRAGLERALGPRAEAAGEAAAWAERFNPVKEEEKMARSGVDFVLRGSAGFPRLLAEIHDPPVGLYRKGPFACSGPCVAIVGTRRATDYGMSIAKRLGSELAQRGICVVSGLARGIDTAAHEGALSAAGRTAAILATGIDVIFPSENLALYRKIAETGAVLSEFPFGRPADKDSIPMRSRLISGMCEAVVVVESDRWGGAMTTARFAGEQGRLVFAVPGRIDQSTSSGTNLLIRDGAAMLTSIDDLLQEMQFLGARAAEPEAGA